MKTKTMRSYREKEWEGNSLLRIPPFPPRVHPHFIIVYDRFPSHSSQLHILLEISHHLPFTSATMTFIRKFVG